MSLSGWCSRCSRGSRSQKELARWRSRKKPGSGVRGEERGGVQLCRVPELQLWLPRMPVRLCRAVFLEGAALVGEQPALAGQAAAEAGEGAVGADHPVAGDHDGDRVLAVGEADSARRVRLADLGGQL